MDSLFEFIYDNLDSVTYNSLTEFFFKKKPKKTEEELKQELDEDIKATYYKFVKWWDKPYSLGDGYDRDIIVMARLLKVSERDLCKRVMKHLRLLKVQYLDDDKSVLYKLKKVFKSGTFYELLGNDTYCIAIDPDTQIIYEIDVSRPFTLERFNYTSFESYNFDDSDITRWISENNIVFKK